VVHEGVSERGMEFVLGLKGSTVVVNLLRFEKGVNGFKLNFPRVRGRCDVVEREGSSEESPGIVGSGLGARLEFRLEFRDEFRLPCRLAVWEPGGVGPVDIDERVNRSLPSEW
jgi:hypothetical protein